MTVFETLYIMLSFGTFITTLILSVLELIKNIKK